MRVGTRFTSGLVALLVAGVVLACAGPTPDAAPEAPRDRPRAKATPAEAPVQPEPESTVVVDIPAIALKDAAAVALELGDPGPCSSVKYGQLCSYRGGNVEVVFINGQADWITVYGSEAPSDEHPALDCEVSAEALDLLALPQGTATEGPLGLFFVGTVAGTVEVILWKTSLNDDALSYAYVKLATE